MSNILYFYQYTITIVYKYMDNRMNNILYFYQYTITIVYKYG